jgi:hypothetical protein
MLNAFTNVGDHFCKLRLSLPAVAVDKHPHRAVIFPDPVDPAGQVVFGAECGFEKPFCYLGVREVFFLNPLSRNDSGILGGNGRLSARLVERVG